MANVRLIIGVVVVVVSMVYLFAYAIPNVQRAQENVRIAQEEYDQAILEQEQAMAELDASVNEVLNEESIN